MPDTLSHAFFYNSENGDRVYDADSFEYLLKKFFTSGVFAGSCQVTADGQGMTCAVGSGYANCDGKVRFFSASTNLAFANAHPSYDRIDTVVVERNDSDRDITLKVVTGTYSATPVATEPVRSNGVYQLVLAEVSIEAGTTAITQAMITDKRVDTGVCGYVMCAVTTPDFSALYDQFTAQFLEWFDHMKDQLTEDAAGNLQTEIDVLADDLDAHKIITISVSASTNTSVEIQNAAITANHRIAAESHVNSKASVTWETREGLVTLSCAAGIPAMKLMAYLPAE